MKKMTRFLALILALSMLSTVAVGAENGNPQGVYNIVTEEGYTLTPLTAAGAAPTTHKETIDKKEVTVYEATEKFTLSFTGKSDVQYVVFLLSPGSAAPDKDNIRYIDQKADDESMSFTIYPDDITKAGTYGIYLSSSENAYTEVASFTVTKPPYPVGDVDQSGAMDVGDATRLLRYLADLTTASDVVNLDVADVDGSGGVDVGDVTKMLRVLADLDTL